MYKTAILLSFAISFYACDDQDEQKNSFPLTRDAAIEQADMELQDQDVPVEYYDFDTISIEPNDDFGPDMDS